MENVIMEQVKKISLKNGDMVVITSPKHTVTMEQKARIAQALQTHLQRNNIKAFMMFLDKGVELQVDNDEPKENFLNDEDIRLIEQEYYYYATRIRKRLNSGVNMEQAVERNLVNKIPALLQTIKELMDYWKDSENDN